MTFYFFPNQNYAAGGFWILRFSHTNSINRIWEELVSELFTLVFFFGEVFFLSHGLIFFFKKVFSLIGERFEDDVVVGAVLSLRKQEDYISIWLKDNNPRFTIGFSFVTFFLLCLSLLFSTLFFFPSPFNIN